MDKKELPMYKDKPYNYAGSRKYTPVYRRKRILGGAILIVIGLAYWAGILSTSTVKPKPRDTSKSAWNWLSSPAMSASVNWDDRREKVKEAFMLSWDGYEQYAWGKSFMSWKDLRCHETCCPRGDFELCSRLTADDHVSQASMSTIPYRKLGNKWIPMGKAWAG